MKKNSKKAGTQQPRMGEFYKIEESQGLYLGNVIEIVNVEECFAWYYFLNDNNYICRWDFIKFPEIINQKLSPLECELL